MLADTALDIELVFPEVRGTAPEPPALSGVVFEKTTQGRRPVAGTPVVYYTVYEGTYDVYTHTDSNGRYEFCRIPLGTGLLMAGDCNDSMMPMPVDIRGDTVVDIDLTSFMASCRMVR